MVTEERVYCGRIWLDLRMKGDGKYCGKDLVARIHYSMLGVLRLCLGVLCLCNVGFMSENEFQCKCRIVEDK